jgi:hypothetical protein
VINQDNIPINVVEVQLHMFNPSELIGIKYLQFASFKAMESYYEETDLRSGDFNDDGYRIAYYSPQYITIEMLVLPTSQLPLLDEAIAIWNNEQ